MMPMNDASEHNVATAIRVSWTRPQWTVRKLRRRVAARFRMRRKFQRSASGEEQHGPQIETPVIILGLVYAAAILLMIARLV
jgi:hypothetical protein